MSRTLNLVDRLLSQGRHLHELGLYSQSAQLLKRLLGLRKLPGKVVEESRSLLADMEVRQGHFARGRRNLAVAIAHEPANADYQHRLAVALEDDPQASPMAALEAYDRCLALDPDNPHYLCDYA